jgi:hypothetical protein
MATENRSRFEQITSPGLFAVALESFRRYGNEWQKVLTVRKSKKTYEESGYASGFGYMVEKPEGTPITYDARLQGAVKRWTHKTWALAFRATEEAIEDDNIGMMTKGSRDLGVSARATQHLLAMRVFMNATATTYHTAGDSKAIAATDHVRLGGGTWSNLGDAADPSEASLEAAIYNFENIKDHRNKPYMQKAKMVVCGPSNKFKFKKLLNSSQEPESANNAINPVKDEGLKLYVDELITDGRWFLLGDKDPDVGLIWFDRKKPTMSKHGDPDTGDAKFMVKMRCSVEVNDPRQIYMVNVYS